MSGLTEYATQNGLVHFAAAMKVMKQQEELKTPIKDVAVDMNRR
jgi:hypothetical protein